VIGLVTLPFATVPLLWRRTHPGPVLAVIASAFAVAALFTAREPNGAGLLFGMFAAALYGDRRTRIAAGGSWPSEGWWWPSPPSWPRGKRRRSAT